MLRKKLSGSGSCLLVVLLAAMVLTATGCNVSRRPQLVDDVYKVTLQAGQYAMDLNSSGRPNAASVRIMLYTITRDGPVAVLGSGTAEINLYQDNVVDENELPVKPIYTWRLKGDEMQVFASEIYGLLCYQISLKWPRSVKIEGDSVTLQAVYTGSDDIPVASMPTRILIK